MAYHWKDIEGKEETKFSPGYEIGFDVSLELIDKYPAKSLLTDRAMRLGYYVGMLAGQNEGRGQDDSTLSRS